jgi:hypothetical protein
MREIIDSLARRGDGDGRDPEIGFAVAHLVEQCPDIRRNLIAHLDLQALGDLVPEIDTESSQRAVLVDDDRRQHTGHNPQLGRTGLGSRGCTHREQRHQHNRDPTQHPSHKSPPHPSSARGTGFIGKRLYRERPVSEKTSQQ